MVEQFVDQSPGVEGWYRLRLVAWSGVSDVSQAVFAQAARTPETLTVPTLAPTGEPVPIQYRVAERCVAKLTIVDVRGRTVWASTEDVPGGQHVSYWNQKTPQGTAVTRGVYFVRLSGSRGILVRRLVLLGR